MPKEGLSKNLRTLVAASAVGLLAMGLVGGTALAQTKLLVYTAVEADELKMFKDAFEADYPDVEIKWVRDSTGIITAKLLAELANPRAEIVWGVSGSSLVLLATKGYFQAYKPKGFEKLSPIYSDPARPPQYVGQRAYIASVCYNTIEAKKKGLPKPASWKDLAKPVYKGHVVMPNPNSSGTGFLTVSAWLQTFGEDAAWKFMDGLHKNIAWYTHSGSKPCRQAGAGEIPIGITFAYRAAVVKGKGAPIDIIAPKEGLGWEAESFGIVRGVSGKKLAAAKNLADWSVTRKANVLYNKGMAVVAMPGVAKPVEHFPPDIEKKMIKNDFAWAAANRGRILKQWQNRYGAKSLPKKK